MASPLPLDADSDYVLFVNEVSRRRRREEQVTVTTELQHNEAAQQQHFDEDYACFLRSMGVTNYNVFEEDQNVQEDEEDEVMVVDEGEEEPDVIDVTETEPTGSIENQQAAEDEEGREKRRRVENGNVNGSENQQDQWNRNNIDGLFCPICHEAWTTGGDHHLCCLPCGHLYGFSCIDKWRRRSGLAGKCPQCCKKFTFQEIRKLFAGQITAVDEAAHNRIRVLEAKCASLAKAYSIEKEIIELKESLKDVKDKLVGLETEVHAKLDTITTQLEPKLEVVIAHQAEICGVLSGL